MKQKGMKQEDYIWSKHAKQVAENEDIFYQVNERLKKQKSTLLSEKGIPMCRFYKQKNRKGKEVVYVKDLRSQGALKKAMNGNEGIKRMLKCMRKSEIDAMAKAEQSILGKTIKSMKSVSKGTLDLTFVEGGIMRFYGGCEELNGTSSPIISAYCVMEHQKQDQLRKEIQNIDEEMIRLKEARFDREKILDSIDDIEKRPSEPVNEKKAKHGRPKKKVVIRDYIWSDHAKQVAEEEAILSDVDKRLADRKSVMVEKAGKNMARFFKQKGSKNGRVTVYVKDLRPKQKYKKGENHE